MGELVDGATVEGGEHGEGRGGILVFGEGVRVFNFSGGDGYLLSLQVYVGVGGGGGSGSGSRNRATMTTAPTGTINGRKLVRTNPMNPPKHTPQVV